MPRKRDQLDARRPLSVQVALERSDGWAVLRSRRPTASATLYLRAWRSQTSSTAAEGGIRSWRRSDPPALGGSVSGERQAGSPFARTQVGPTDPPILLCDGDTVFGSRKVAAVERMPADSPRPLAWRRRERRLGRGDGGVDEEPAPAPRAGASTAPAVAVRRCPPRRRFRQPVACVIAFVADDAFADARRARPPSSCDRQRVLRALLPGPEARATSRLYKKLDAHAARGGPGPLSGVSRRCRSTWISTGYCFQLAKLPSVVIWRSAAGPRPYPRAATFAARAAAGGGKARWPAAPRLAVPPARRTRSAAGSRCQSFVARVRSGPWARRS